MPGMDDDRVKQELKKRADGQKPDVWSGIERRISTMNSNQTASNTKKRWSAGLTVAVAACAVVALVAVAAFGYPGFLLKAGSNLPSDPSVIRQPVPYSDSTSVSAQKGASGKIRVFESVADLTANEFTSDVAVFKLVKELGVKSVDDGMRLYTEYQMEAVKVFKGGLKSGDRITVSTFGGANDSVWVEDDYVERFTGDFEYVLFLGKNDDGVYQLASPLQGYVPVRNGLVSLNTKIENNGLYQQAEKLEELSAKIEAAVK